MSRRSLLAAASALPIALIAAGCSPSPTPPPATTSPAAPRPTGPMGEGAPERVMSFGPNGTHYPRGVPWLGATAATEIEVECSWAAISGALGSLTAEQVAEGAVIRVAPGTLGGNGPGSNNTPVLDGVGSRDWTANVLICPRDGYGTVVADENNGFRINDSHGLSLFGLSGPRVGFVLTECSRIQVGWGRWGAMGITRGGSEIEMHELVLGFVRAPIDTFGVRPTDANDMLDIRRFGCVFGPAVKPADSDAHLDTLQLEGTGVGRFGPFESLDCVDFGSSNAAVLLHTGLERADFEHCMILGDRLPWRVFPLEPGDYQGRPNAFAGGARDVRLDDCIVAGAIGRVGFTHVRDTSINYAPVATQQPSREGSWRVDSSIDGWSRDDILGRMETDLSDESLAALWSW